MNKNKKYQNHPLIPFWNWGKTSQVPPALKLPKNFRKHNSLQIRTLQSIKIDKKTGEYLRK